MPKTRHNRKIKKHMRRKQSRKYSKKHKKHVKRGGGVNGPLAAAPFLPPNGQINVPVPGITNQQDQQYYYAHNGRVVPNPESTNKALVMKRGGRKSRRKLKKRKSKKSKKSHKRKSKKNIKKRRRRRHRGGSLSKIVESIPGGTDLRDVYYKTTGQLGSLYSQYNGYGPTNEPPMSNYVDQPIARIQKVEGNTVPMAQYVGDGSNQVSKPQFSANYN